MWKFLEELKTDLEREKAKLDGEMEEEQEENQKKAALLSRALQDGQALMSDEEIHSPISGTLDAINDSSESVEFYFEDGSALWVEFLLTRVGIQTLVHAGQKVEKDQPLARFLESDFGAQVYYLPADAIADFCGGLQDLMEDDSLL